MTKLLQDLMVHFTLLPYKWGGDDFEGMDCSGAVQELLASVGADPEGDQTAQALFNFFSQPANHTSQDPQPGALCFYGGGRTAIVHVTMCYDRRLMFEMAGGGASTTDRAAAAKANAYGRIRPIRFGRTLQGIYMPEYPGAAYP